MTVNVSSEKPSPSTLDDVIELLRLCANANESVFPLWLSVDDDTGTPMAIPKKFADTLEQQLGEGDDAAKTAAIEKVQKFGTALGRSMAFLLSIQTENDWNYFGGAKLNDRRRVKH